MALQVYLQFLLVALACGCNQTSKSSILTDGPVVTTANFGAEIPDGGTFRITSQSGSDERNTVQCMVYDELGLITSVSLICGTVTVSSINNINEDNSNTTTVASFLLGAKFVGDTCVCSAVDKTQCYNKTSSFKVRNHSTVYRFTANGVPTQLDVPAGTNVTLECSADASPNVLAISGTHFHEVKGQDTNNLTTTFVASIENSGQFQCMATDNDNPVDPETFRSPLIRIRVIPVPAGFHGMPYFTANNKTEVLIVEPGTEVQFECYGDGYPNHNLVVRARTTGRVLTESTDRTGGPVRVRKTAHCNSTDTYECSITGAHRKALESLELRVTCGNGVARNDFELVYILISALITGLVMKIRNL